MKQTVMFGHVYSEWAKKREYDTAKNIRSQTKERAGKSQSDSIWHAAPRSGGRNSTLEGNGAYAETIRYDVSRGASRVAEIMNQDPYLSAGRDASVVQGRTDAADLVPDEDSFLSSRSAMPVEPGGTDVVDPVPDEDPYLASGRAVPVTSGMADRAGTALAPDPWLSAGRDASVMPGMADPVYHTVDKEVGDMAEGKLPEDYFEDGAIPEEMAREMEMIPEERYVQEKKDLQSSEIAQQGKTDQTEKGSQEDVQEEEARKAEEKKNSGFNYSEDDLKYMERLLEGIRESRSKIRKPSVKRTPVYNYRRISGSISRAKTRMQANNALSTAKSTLTSLKRKLGTGKYKEQDLKIAITHATKMVRTARKKVANLKAEELLDKSDQDIIQKKERDNTEVKQILQNDIQESVELDQELELLEKRLKQLTKAEKNSHRRNEDYDLLVADMEYLKKKIDLLIQERDEKNSQSTVQASSMNMASAAGEGASSVSGGDSSASGGTAAEADTGAAPGGAGSASSVPAAAGTGFSESV